MTLMSEIKTKHFGEKSSCILILYITQSHVVHFCNERFNLI